MATLQEYIARRDMVKRSGAYGSASAGSQGKYWWIREREDEDVLTAARRAGLYGNDLKQQAQPQKSDAGFFERSFETGVDAVGNILSGAAKSLEGIFDLGLGAIGAVGGIFDKGVRDEMRRIVEYDFTGENVSKHFDRWSDDSVLNNSKAGHITESVLSGVGQMLPTVVISVATGGAATPAMLALGASAAGNATEEAFRDGADYYRGLGYGVVSGGVEVATEKIFDGLGGLLGGGMLDNVTRSVAKTGAARAVKDMVGEAAEEALAEVVNPLAKSIYKGRDALSDYGNADYWGGVGEAALVGGLTSAAYGGTVGRALKTGGKYADVAAVKEEIEAINQKRRNLFVNDKLTDAQEDILQKSEVANYRVLERILQKSGDKKRADLIKRGGLSEAFDESGTLRTDFLRSLGENVTDGQTDAPAANEAQGAKLAAVDKRYVTPSLYYKADTIKRDLEAIAKDAGQEAGSIRVFSGELDADERAAYKKLKQVEATLSEKSNGAMQMVLVEENSAFRGAQREGGNTIYISKETLKDGSWSRILTEEAVHFTQGTQEYAQLAAFLVEDEQLLDRVSEELTKEGNTYGFTKEDVEAFALAQDAEAEAELTERQRAFGDELGAHMAAEVLDNEAVIDRLVGEQSTLAEKIMLKIKDIRRAFLRMTDKDARAQYDRVKRAEGLYYAAIERRGWKVIDGKILGNDDEKIVIHYSLKRYTDHQKENWKNSKRILVYESEEQFRDFIKTACTNPTFNKKIYFGAIPEEYASVIKSKTGIDVNNYNCTLASEEIRKIFKDHGDEQRESLRGQRKITEDDILHISDVLQSPDKIKLSDKKYDGKDAIEFTKNFNGRLTVVAIVSDKHLDLRVQTAYAGIKKGDLATPTDEQASVNTPEASGGTVSDNSIPQNSDLSTGKTNFNRKDVANQQASDDIDALMKSAGIEGEATEIREELVDLYARARNIVKGAEDDADLKKEKEFVERVAKRIAGNMARDVDGETREEMAERLRREILSGTEFAEQEAEAPKEPAKDEPKPKKTGYTYDDVHGMMDAVKKILTFETSSGRVVEGKIYRNDAWEVNKKIYQVLKAGELRKKSEVAREVANLITDIVMVQERDAYGKTIHKRLSGALHGEELEAARQEIALEIAMQMGDRAAKKYNKRMADVKYEAQRLSDMKKGRYVNASGYKGDTFKKALSELARINWRGGLVSSKKIRERFAQLSEWYTPSNPLYGNGGVKNEQFRQSIFDALDFVGDTTRGALTMEDIDAAEMILKYFAREIETYGTIYKDEKRQDAMPIVKGYIEKAERAKAIMERSGVLQGILRNKFTRLIADPAFLMREADSHIEGGFFTEQFEELRRGTIDAAVKEHEMAAEFVAFWESNKEYGKRYNDAEVDFGGKKMPLQEAIALYMTMKREHAFAGLAYAGFEIEGKKGTVNVSNGFGDIVEKYKVELINKLPPEKALNMTKADESELHAKAIEAAVNQMRGELYNQFTAEDKRLISIMERGFEECREVKIKNDQVIMGYSNVIGGYYFPVKRAGLAENVDIVSLFEGDRVSNLPFNKDTVKNAHKLLIEPAHIVYMRHVKAISLYDGLGIFTDNFNRLYNLNIIENANNPVTVRTTLSQSGNFVKEMMPYFKELKQDIEGISKKRSSERFYNDAVAAIRSAYASYQLGFNPKTWASQFSSLIASMSKLDVASVTGGLSVSGKDVDDYCKLAWLRNNDGDAVLAQSVTTGMNPVQRAGRNALQKVRDVSMLPIGKVDRIVVEKLFAACQVQVEKEKGIKAGTKENKIAAGELLEVVILETQQNSMATERTAAMRSGDEMLKGFNMFIADAMKVQARMIEPYAKMASLYTQRRMAVDAKNQAEVARLDKQIEVTRKECVRATSVLVGVSVFNALLAYGFKWLYRRDEEEDVGTVAADAFGNMIGGIPFVRDAYSYFVDGFEAEHFAIATLNDVLKTTADTAKLLQDAADGKDISQQEALKAVRDVLYAAGQLSGVPTRNLYNNITGIASRMSRKADYAIDGAFYKPSYASDLAAAIEADDEGMISLIASMMLEDKVGDVDAALSTGLHELVEKGYDVLPRVLGDTITYDGEEVALTKRQRERFRAVYAVAQEQILSMMKLRQYKEASEEVRAKAIKMIWGVYWDLAVDDVLGVDSSEKNVLFAEAIDMDKLALIVATAREIKADYNEAGKAISGTRLAKIEAYVEKLNLKAAQKYMVMGYLGYKNKNGEDQVRSYINSLSKLSKAEREALMGYAGYGNG